MGRGLESAACLVAGSRSLENREFRISKVAIGGDTDSINLRV